MNLYIKKVKNSKGEIKEWLWINFTVDGKRCRKSLKLENTKNNYKKATNELLPTLKYKLLNGEIKKISKEIPIIDEFIEYSFELHKGERTESTIYGHRKNYNKYIKSIFGNKKIDKIYSDEITIWQNSLQEKNRLSKAYIKKIRGILYTLFEDAIKKKLVVTNPVKEVNNLKETENPKTKRLKLTPFKTKEINELLNIAEGQNRNLIATLFFTGLRIGECIALKWDSIDFENKTIQIQSQIVNGNIKNILKSSHSNRIIPIIDSLLPFLKEQYILTSKSKSFIFLTEKTNKHYHSAGKVREQIWLKLFDKTDIKYRNLHQTRGTFISTLISNGEDINYVSKIAGHESVKITLDKYSQYIPAPNKDFGKCFNKVLANNDTNLAPKEKSSL